MRITPIIIDQTNVDTEGSHVRDWKSTPDSMPIDWRAVALTLTLHVFLLGMIIGAGINIPALHDDKLVEVTIDTKPLINARLIEISPLPSSTQDYVASDDTQGVLAEVASLQSQEAQETINQAATTVNTAVKEPSSTSTPIEETEQWMPSLDTTLPIAVSPFHSEAPIGREHNDVFNPSALSILPEETRLIIQGLDNQHLQSLSEQASQDYRHNLISPVFPAAPAPLGKQEEAINTIIQAKIDLDCASAINQALVIISTFTLQTAICQNKGNFQQFIDKRLQEKLPPPKIKGVAELKQLARSDKTTMQAQPPTRP